MAATSVLRTLPMPVVQRMQVTAFTPFFKTSQLTFTGHKTIEHKRRRSHWSETPPWPATIHRLRRSWEPCAQSPVTKVLASSPLHTRFDASWDLPWLSLWCSPTFCSQSFLTSHCLPVQPSLTTPTMLPSHFHTLGLSDPPFLIFFISHMYIIR